MSEPLLPDFAAKIAEWFPELGGRSIAVSEAEITRENIPRLPLAITALTRSDMDGSWNWKATNSQQKMYDDFVTEFWLAPMKVTRSNGNETPFWAFYDYELFRNKLLSHVSTYMGPREQRLEYRNMTIESDQYAVVLAFVFRAHFQWCREDEQDSEDGKPINSNTIATKMCQPKSTVCDPCFDEPTKECNPCPSQ